MPPAGQASAASASAHHHHQQQPAFIAPDDSDFLESEDGDATDGSEEEGADRIAHQEPREATVTISSAAAHLGTSPRRRTVPKPVHHVLQIADRFYFAVFDHPAPSAAALDAHGGTDAAVFPTEPSLLYGSWIRREFEAQRERVAAKGRQQTRDPRWQPLPGKVPDRFHWFSIDDDLQYSCFFDDWGPLNAAALFRFCTEVQTLMENERLDGHGIVLYTTTDSRKKTNAATICALRNLITDEGLSPADAFHPFAEMEFQPFRDAGYGRADYFLTMQDVLYGVYRARSLGLFDMTTFNLDEYEHFEQVQHGDWNWITPQFIAFASPNDREYVKQLHLEAQAQQQQAAAAGPSGSASPYRKAAKGYPPNCTQVIDAFKQRDVRLIVRLNNPLYDKHMFTREGMEHLELYFDDGSNPSDEILRAFIDAADRVVEAGGVIAVHCKAGLGRTGVLIGAYLIWKYGFNPSEVIGLMRLMRPGCVVGPQQQFIYEKANEWVRWGEQAHAIRAADAKISKEREALKAEIARLQAQLRDERTQRSLKRSRSGAPAGGGGGADADAEDEESNSDVEVADMFTPRPAKIANYEQQQPPMTAAPAYKPAPCVGQPRKSPSPSRKRPAALAPATVHRMGSGTARGTASLAGSAADAGGSGARTTSNPFATDGGESPQNLFYAEIKSNSGAGSSQPAHSSSSSSAAAGGNATPGRSAASQLSSDPFFSQPTQVTPRSERVARGGSSSPPAPPRNDAGISVLGEATRINMQHAVPPPMTPPTPRGGFEKTGILGRIERVAESFAATFTGGAGGGGTPGSPPSPRVLAGVARANSSVRNRYGLKDTSKMVAAGGADGVAVGVQASSVAVGMHSPAKARIVGRTAARLASAGQAKATPSTSSSARSTTSARTLARTTTGASRSTSASSAASSSSASSARSAGGSSASRTRTPRPAGAATPSARRDADASVPRRYAVPSTTTTTSSASAAAQPSYMNPTASSSLKRSRGLVSPDLGSDSAVPAAAAVAAAAAAVSALPSSQHSSTSGRNVRARC